MKVDTSALSEVSRVRFKNSLSPSGVIPAVVGNGDTVILRVIFGFADRSRTELDYTIHGVSIDGELTAVVASETQVELPERQVRIQVVPGVHAKRMLQWTFPRKQYELVFATQIADLHHDYIAALSEGRSKKAKWIHVRFWIGLLKSLLLMIPLNLMKAFVDMWKVG